jgi:hypothetical protein
MKTVINLSISIFLLALLAVSPALAQQADIQYFRSNDKDGVNVFEPGKAENLKFEGVQVRVGGDFAIQFQGLSQDNAAGNTAELVNNMNLPTANLNIDVQLAQGVRMHLRTYLSSRHHNEGWVKGGYLQIDDLDFIEEGFLEGLMENVRIRVGMDDVNYGDAHFRRSDNARAIFNPFVGNYLMDSFTTEVFGEVSYLKDGFIGVLSVTNGKLNQQVEVGTRNNFDNALSYVAKLGYDKQINDDLRVRLTGSIYTNNGFSTGTYLFGGDRAGGRYYGVPSTVDEGAGDFDPRINPRFSQMTAIQINPFVKFKGLEVFGIIETVSDGDETKTFTVNGADLTRSSNGGSFNQFAIETLYRFGKTEQFYVGGRYNSVSGEFSDGGATAEATRINIGGGWFMTKNVMMKAEFMSQEYSGAHWAGTRFDGAEFDGFNIEAVISF